MRETFAQVAAPVAAENTPGAFLGPWRKMSIDGLEWDVSDTGANAAAFGYPGSGKDGSPAAFPKARAVTIGEYASHDAGAGGDGAVHVEGQRRAVPGPRPVSAAQPGLAADRRPQLLQPHRRPGRHPRPRIPPDQRQRVLDQVMAEITSPKHLGTRRERSYPRVVKRARHNSYRFKKPGRHGTRHNAPATIQLINPPARGKTGITALPKTS